MSRVKVVSMVIEHDFAVHSMVKEFSHQTPNRKTQAHSKYNHKSQTANPKLQTANTIRNSKTTTITNSKRQPDAKILEQEANLYSKALNPSERMSI